MADIIKDPEIFQESTLSAQQQKLLNEVLLPFLSSPGPGEFQPDQFGGALPGGGAVESLSLQGLEDFVNSLVTGQGEGAQGTRAAQSSLQDILSLGPRDIDEFFTESVEAPALEAFTERVQPAIGRRFGGENFFGSERRRADERASEDLIDALTQSRASTAFTERGADIQRQLQAAGLIPGLEAPAQFGAAIGAAGAARAPEERAVQFDFQKFLTDQKLKSQRVDQILAALGLDTVENIAFPGVIEGGQDDFDIGGLLAGLGGAAKGAAALKTFF